MDKNSPTYKVAIQLLKQSAEAYQHPDFHWFVSAIMRLIVLDNDLSLVDFLVILKDEIPQQTNEMFDSDDKKLYEGSFSKFIEQHILVSKK